MDGKFFSYLAAISLMVSFLPAVSAGLLFYEPFDDTSSIAANGGVVSGSLNFTSLDCGNAGNLTSGAYITYPLTDNFPASGDMTIEFWVRNTRSNGQGLFDVNRMVGTSPNSMGIFYNVGYVITEVRNAGAGMTQAWSAGGFNGRWGHVAVTFSNYQSNCSSNPGHTCFDMITYLNANPGWTVRVYDFHPNLAGNMWVGRNYWYGVSNAYMDEFKIYDYAKTQAELYQDYLQMKSCTASAYPPQPCVMYKPQSTGPVQINCSGLYVDGKPFTAKGVGYQPIPIGRTADVAGGSDVIYDTPAIYNRDLPLLRAMGANTIRTWGEVTNGSFLDAAWNGGNKPIRVLMGFWINCNENYADAGVRQSYINKFKAYVTEYKDYPAVLAWALGNENNLGYCSSSAYVDDFYSLCNELAKAAYEIEGSDYHPVGIVNGDLGGIGQAEFGSQDASLNYTDFWGDNVYPGRTFGSWFSDYASVSGKPLFITEYGIDALNDTSKTEYEAVQAQWDLNQWQEIDAAPMTIGSTIMAYSDEWWKAGSVNTHDYGGYSTGNHPDGYSNEEWWGVVRTVDNGNDPDIMQPRQVYYALKSEWGGITCSSNADCGTDRWVGSPSCAGKDVYQNYTTYTCSSPGTQSASCSSKTVSKLKQSCPTACSAGACVNISCYTNTDCGIDSWVGTDVCSGKDIWNTWRTYTCSNAGTPSASCTSSDASKLKQTCPVGCSAGECSIACSLNSDCGTDGWIGADVCNGKDIWNTWRAYTCQNPGTTSASCKSTDTSKLKQTCLSACLAGKCANITCSSNSDCGTDTWVGTDTCNGKDIWNTWKTYKCNNPGTALSTCTSTQAPKLKQTCPVGCSAGACSIACSLNGDCGTDGWVGANVCGANNVWNKWRTYKCEYPGTILAYCTSKDESKLKETCSSGCSNGVCLNITCFKAADCGTNGWVGNTTCNKKSVMGTWRTYSCTSAGTVAAACTHKDVTKKKQACPVGCEAGACTIECSADTDCGINTWIKSDYCVGRNVWNKWATYTCLKPGTIYAKCKYTAKAMLKEACVNGTCLAGKCVPVECFKNADCGTNDWIGNDTCNGKSVMNVWRTYSCKSAGKATAYCTYTDKVKKKQACPVGCESGACTIACYSNADCGADGWLNKNYCRSGNVWDKWRAYICLKPGTVYAKCSYKDASKLKEDCVGTCSAGVCV